MRKSYEPGWKAPADIDERTFIPPISKVGQFIMDHHIVSKTVGVRVSIASNMLLPSSGTFTGKAVELGLNQFGYGNKHKHRHPQLVNGSNQSSFLIHSTSKQNAP